MTSAVERALLVVFLFWLGLLLAFVIARPWDRNLCGPDLNIGYRLGGATPCQLGDYEVRP